MAIVYGVWGKVVIVYGVWGKVAIVYGQLSYIVVIVLARAFGVYNGWFCVHVWVES